jgi:hypothetical protein
MRRLRKMDKERRKQAVQNGQAAADDFKPSDLGPTCLIVTVSSSRAQFSMTDAGQTMRQVGPRSDGLKSSAAFAA